MNGHPDVLNGNRHRHVDVVGYTKRNECRVLVELEFKTVLCRDDIPDESAFPRTGRWVRRIDRTDSSIAAVNVSRHGVRLGIHGRQVVQIHSIELIEFKMLIAESDKEP